MPLSMVETGKTYTIIRISGNDEARLFLEKLAFVVGAQVTVVSSAQGNLIVNIKESRVAIGKAMATKILVA